MESYRLSFLPVSCNRETMSLTIGINLIPSYLRSSAFFRNLTDDLNTEEQASAENAYITIPSNCFKRDARLGSVLDISWFLKTLDFWGSNALPTGLIHFCMSSDPAIMETPLKQYIKSLPQLKPLLDIMAVRRSVVVDLMNVILIAVAAGSMPIFRYLLHFGTTIQAKGYSKGSSLSQNITYDVRVCETAVLHGHLTCLDYACAEGFPLSSRCCLLAAGAGHVDCLEYLHKAGCPLIAGDLAGGSKSSESSLSTALAAAPGPAVFSQSHDGSHPITYVPPPAFRCNHVQCRLRGQAEQCPWVATCCVEAARHGHLACLQYAHRAGCPIDARTCAAAVDGKLRGLGVGIC